MDISLTGMTVMPNNTKGSGTGLLSGGIDFGWQPGQVFEGMVLDRVAENTYSIRVDGKDVLAVSPFVLAKDQAITMEVQGKNNSQYIVRLLDFALTGEGDVLKSIINQLGMKDEPLNRALIQGFLSQELPLKPELLQQVARTLQVSGRNLPEDVNQILLALKWKIPPNPRVLEAIQAFLSGLLEKEMGSESQLAHLTQELAGFLDEIQEGYQSPGEKIAQPFPQKEVPPITLSNEVTVLFQQVKDMLGAMILKPQEGAEKVAEQLRSLLGFQLPKSFPKGAEAESELTLEGLKTFAVTTPDKAVIDPPITLSKEETMLFQQVKDMLGAMILKPQEGAEKVLEQLRSLLGFQLPESFPKGAKAESEFTLEGLETFTVTAPDKAVTDPPQDSLLSAPVSQEDTPAPVTMKSALKDAWSFDIVSDGYKSGQNIDGSPDKTENGPTPETRTVCNEINAKIHGKVFRAFGDLLERFGQLLLEVRVAVKEAGSFEEGQRIVHKGADIERQMAGHQIFQSLQRDSCQQDYLYFNLPFINNGENETWGQLRIFKNADGKKIIDPKRFSTVILLNTENLGPLLLEIKVWNKEVTANGKVTEDWVALLLKKAWPKLQAPFEAMGYHLRQCQWDVGPFEDNLRPGEVDPPKVRRGFRFLDTKI